jgi:hypothetical protein
LSFPLGFSASAYKKTPAAAGVSGCRKTPFFWKLAGKNLVISRGYKLEISQNWTFSSV